MIIFLYGSDAYRLRRDKQDIIEKYKSKYQSGMSLVAVDLSGGAGMGDVYNAVKSVSFFNEHKLIAIDNAFLNKNTAQDLEKLFKEYKLAGLEGVTILIAAAQTSK